MRRWSVHNIIVTTGVMASDSKLIPPVYSAASSGLHPEASGPETKADKARRRLHFCLPDVTTTCLNLNYLYSI